MDIQDYHEMSNAQRGEPWHAPAEFFDDEGHLDVDAMMTTLEVFDYIHYDDDDKIVVHSKLKLDMPDVYDMLMMILRNVEQSQLDQLVESGVLNMSINQHGEAVYTYTEDGARIVNRYLEG